MEKVYKTNSGDFLSLVIPSRTNIGYTVLSPSNNFIVAVDPYLWKSPNFGETLKVAYYNPKADTRINYFFAKGKGCAIIEEFPDEGVAPRKSPL